MGSNPLERDWHKPCSAFGFGMKTEQSSWRADRGWETPPSSWQLGDAAQVVFLFGNAKWINANGCLDAVRTAYPKAHVFGCSTAGEIHGTHVDDDTIALAALAFEHTQVVAASARIEAVERSFEAGER